MTTTHPAPAAYVAKAESFHHRAEELRRQQADLRAAGQTERARRLNESIDAITAAAEWHAERAHELRQEAGR